VVIAGVGMPGAAAVSTADWDSATPVTNVEDLAETTTKTGLGAGEVSARQLSERGKLRKVGYTRLATFTGKPGSRWQLSGQSLHAKI
jgi:hypothetical protein